MLSGKMGRIIRKVYFMLGSRNTYHPCVQLPKIVDAVKVLEQSW